MPKNPAATTPPPAMEPSDAEWLCGPEAAGLLSEIADSPPSVTLTATLRKHFSAQRTALLLEQADLRRRAPKKFERAHAMFFTRTGLEQATDQWTAAYKAQRFSGSVADLCTGVGGDLLALAQRGDARGVDRDPVLCRFAVANAAANNASVKAACREASAELVANANAWHADPDRRATGRRSTQINDHSPNLATLDALHAACPQAAIKLAPAADPPPHWQADRELEWISRGGECRQLVVWSGQLAIDAGRRKATTINKRGAAASFVGDARVTPDTAPAVGRFIFEPNPAVLAARIDGALAHRHGLQRLTPAAAYLTGDSPIEDPLLASFEVVETLPLRTKTIAGYLRERGVGELEIKHRGVAIDPSSLRKQLRLRGEQRATLIGTTVARKAVAYLVKSVSHHT